MSTALRTDRSSELFILSKGMIRGQLKRLRLLPRLKLANADINLLADELALKLARAPRNPDGLSEFLRSAPLSPELQLLFDPTAKKRN